MIYFENFAVYSLAEHTEKQNSTRDSLTLMVTRVSYTPYSLSLPVNTHAYYTGTLFFSRKAIFEILPLEN